MPTYNRPDMFRRAVDSLQGQTYPHWKAIVSDDSTNEGVRDVVEAVNDHRITYRKNQVRMGATGNIDQCFSPQAMFAGQYGYVLEDDNYLLPDFLKELSENIANGNCELILANQRINEEGSGLLGPESTTRGDWFFDGIVNPLYLRASLLFMEGISNGGLVWRLEDKVDLRVGPHIKVAGLHEACRSLLIRVPFLFIAKALTVWTSLPQSDSARAQDTNRSFGRGMQSIRSFVLRHHGRAVVDVAREISRRRGLDSRLVEALAYSGYPHLAGDLVGSISSASLRGLAKGLTIRLIKNDPCDTFIRSLSTESRVLASA